MGKVRAERRVRAWGADQRRALVAEDAAMRMRNAGAADASQREHHFSKLYLPHAGMFCEPPQDLQLGTRLPVRAAVPAVQPRALAVQLWLSAPVLFWPAGSC